MHSASSGSWRSKLKQRSFSGILSSFSYKVIVFFFYYFDGATLSLWLGHYQLLMVSELESSIVKLHSTLGIRYDFLNCSFGSDLRYLLKTFSMISLSFEYLGDIWEGILNVHLLGT